MLSQFRRKPSYAGSFAMPGTSGLMLVTAQRYSVRGLASSAAVKVILTQPGPDAYLTEESAGPVEVRRRLPKPGRWRTAGRLMSPLPLKSPRSVA
jgi:hypothetical protein